MTKITILALIVAVILGECLAAFLFLGRSGPVVAADAATAAKKAEQPAEKKEHASKDHGAKADHGAEGQQAAEAGSVLQGANKEVDLGEYSIMASDPASGTMLMIDFHIFGTVAASDLAEFQALYEEHHHRIRGQVIVIVRSAEMSDLTDASLGLIRRQILDKTNELLGKPLVQDIIFSKFSFIEQ
jgi:flagellar FliL protein